MLNIMIITIIIIINYHYYHIIDWQLENYVNVADNMRELWFDELLGAYIRARRNDSRNRLMHEPLNISGIIKQYNNIKSKY